MQLINKKCALTAAVLGLTLAASCVCAKSSQSNDVVLKKEWSFYRVGDRQGWEIPDRLIGAVMGGAIWLHLQPIVKDPLDIITPQYQLWGDWLYRKFAWDPRGKVIVLVPDQAMTEAMLNGPRTGPTLIKIVSAPGLRIEAPKEPDRQLQVRLRVVNESPITDLYLGWKSSQSDNTQWERQRFPLQPNDSHWQESWDTFPGAGLES